MKAIFLIGMLGLFVAPAFAQSPDFSAECKTQMQKLAYFVGNWKGEATHSKGLGKTETIAQQEKIEWRLNGVVLLIEGTGRPMNTEDIVFNAFAVVNYDPADKKFKFKSYVKEGFTTNAYFDVVAENKFEWGFDVPNGGGKTRYIITLDPAKKTWYETGEFSRDGSKWMKFIELNLKKLD
ncbi:hypothetical protein [Spirosoma sp. KNUC1025]|uniref:hypothetical protein n=1 Tax=Spirosoma sp. KNUC1025 TaxID=2894082 RepID=UPI0038674583|nr:DUF1579 domain-containing protein [Spirosoma sp. KNUC1025]